MVRKWLTMASILTALFNMERAMRVAILVITLIAFPALCAAASPGVEMSIQDQNKKLVRDFYELAFNAHKPTEAAKKYIGDRYIQHNPFVPNGAAAFYEYFEGEFKKHPKSHVTIYRVLADGDLVALHLNSKLDDADPGRAIVDIFRVENSKIVEHFDVIQQVPDKTANGNTMFGGDNAK